MKQKDVNEFIRLNKMFDERCDEIVTILSKMDKVLGTNFKYTGTFVPDDDSVFCSGEKYLGYGEYDQYCERFDIKFLTATNDEIRKYVDDKIQAHLKEREEKENAKKLAFIENEKKLLKELLEKYKGEV